MMKKIIYLLSAIACYFLFINASCLEQNNPVGPEGKEIEKKTETITPEGGEIVLTDGTKIFFPSGALSQSTSIKMSKIDSKDFYPSQKDEIVLLKFESEITNFNKDLEIRIPVPKKFTDPSKVIGVGGEFDFEKRILDVTSHQIVNNNGVYELVIKTNHFSEYGGHFWEQPPFSAGPLEVPYLNQGSSTYCWATCLQMMCEGINPSEIYEIYNWIKETGIGESGVGQDFILQNAKLHKEIDYRTGSYPDAKRWQYLSADAMDTYLRDRVALGYPVLVMDPFTEHAILVIGYSGNNFYIHNPNSTTTTSIGYTVRKWSEFRVSELGIRDMYVTLSIPKKLVSSRMQTVNITNGTIQVKKPKSGTSNSMIYGFKWSPTSSGYGFFENNGTGKLADTLPDGVETISIKGIEIANASQSGSKSFSVWVDIWGQDNKKIHKSFPSKNPVSVGPNSLATYSIDIPIADFRDSTAGATTKYRMQITIVEQGGGVADDVSMFFKIGPMDPLNGRWSFSLTRESTTSPKGTYSIDDQVLPFEFLVKSKEVINIKNEEESEDYDFKLERSTGSNAFRISFTSDDGTSILMDCSFTDNSYNKFTGTLTNVDYQYLSDQDEKDDKRTYYTCKGHIVATRK